MANRVIREGINDSKKINQLGFEAEVFYRRLFAIADDFGYFEADTMLLRSDLYKRLVDQIKISDIEKWLKKCEEVGLIDLYEYDGKSYGQILGFGQALRIMRSKFPNKDGKYMTKEEYLRQLSIQQSSDNIRKQTPPETKGSETEKKQEVERERETEALSYIDQWYKDLPNSSHMERVSKLTDIKKEVLMQHYPGFKKKLRSTYKNQLDFVDHFKSWVLQQKEAETPTPIKTTVTFGKKQ